MGRQPIGFWRAIRRISIVMKVSVMRCSGDTISNPLTAALASGIRGGAGTPWEETYGVAHKIPVLAAGAKDVKQQLGRVMMEQMAMCERSYLAQGAPSAELLPTEDSSIAQIITRGDELSFDDIAHGISHMQDSVAEIVAALGIICRMRAQQQQMMVREIGPDPSTPEGMHADRPMSWPELMEWALSQVTKDPVAMDRMMTMREQLWREEDPHTTTMRKMKER